VGGDGRAPGPGLRYAPASCERQPLGHRVERLQWSTPKTHERRSVPFPAVLADELAGLMVGKDRDALVFTDQRGGVLRNSNWRARVFQPAVDKCQKTDDSFPSITPHDLRHTAATWPR
jgi:integrase